jgi:hypothetical protein
MPKRVRYRFLMGIMHSIEIPRIRKNTCRIEAEGGVWIDWGGTTNDVVAITTALTVLPTVPVAGIVQDVTFGVFPAHVRFTLPLNPAKPLTITGIEPAVPLVRLNVAGTVKLKSAVAEPVPVSATVKGCAGATLFAILSVPDSAVATEGVKITPIVHEAPAASVAPQPIAAPGVATKSAAFGPTTVNTVGSVPDELFVTVTVIEVVGVPIS